MTRFLDAVASRKLRVYLILSPEVGVHFPYSGLPKDLILKQENRAQHSHQGKVTINLPPHAYSLPSLFSPEFNKRYSSFLGRMDSVFSDLAKSQPHLLNYVTPVLSGSFWKYYRSALSASSSAFGGLCGDYSIHAALAYRQRVEQFFCQREFMDPNPSAVNRWKNRSFEEINRKWFYQQSEDVFRSRSLHMIQKKSVGLKISEFEIYTPEADPSVTYSNFLQMISGGHADFSKLSSLVEDFTSRSSLASQSAACSFIHWTSMGGFRMLSESEKQFLILKSLLLVGSQGGGILIDEAEWFGLSSSFRSRADLLARSLMEGELQLKNQALYLAPHLWSSYGTLWEELRAKVNPTLKMVSSMDLVLREKFSQLLIVDPAYILTKELIQKLTAWAKAGRVVVIPRSQLYSQAARIELENILLQTKRIEVDLGLTYRLHSLGEGKLVVYDVPESAFLTGEPLVSCQNFLNTILSISEIETYCKLSNNGLFMIPFEKKRGDLAIFVLNGTKTHVPSDIIFSTPVQISDLGLAFLDGVSASGSEEKVLPANRFSLEVPPYGVLPLTVEGLHLSEHYEKQLAALSSEVTRQNALGAATSELTGLNLEEGCEGVWN